MTIRMKAAALLTSLFILLWAAAAAITVDAARWPVTANGRYSSMEEVAVYLATYSRLPSNYITKRDAQARGWDNSLGNLWRTAASIYSQTA